MLTDSGASVNSLSSDADISLPKSIADRLRQNVQTQIVGKNEAIDLALVAMFCRGHGLIEDVPGVGKTTLAKALASSLDCEFRRIQFTPDLMPGDILGVNIFHMKSQQFEFRAGPVFSQVLLADEINRGTPRTQTALLEAMQERQVTVDGDTRKLPEPFIVLATLNPIEMEGTFPLPEAQLDRFMIRISLGYPTHDEESQILHRFGDPTAHVPLGSVISVEELFEAQKSIPRVRFDDILTEYLLQIAEATRKAEEFQLGASPRAALALYQASKAWAAINGRGYVLPDDIKKLATPVLAHRMVMNSQSRLQGQLVNHVIERIVQQVPVPIERESSIERAN